MMMMLPPCSIASISHLARRQSALMLYKRFSSSSLSTQSLRDNPEWLQRILKDNSAPPKLYAWTTANLPDAAPVKPSTRSANRIHILGIGNLGRLFASSLAKLKTKPPVTLILHRKALLEQWASSPSIEITRDGQLERFFDFDVEWWTEERPSTGPVIEATAGAGIVNLIVATKASDALPQVDRLRRYLDSSSTVAFTQNGMCKLWPPTGQLYNSHRFPDAQSPNWIACVTTHGVVSLAPFRSKHASVAAASVGPVSLNAHSGSRSEYLIEQIINGPDLYAKQVSKSELWVSQLEKLTINSVINPLTAILRCKNGELFKSGEEEDQLPVVIDMLIREASDVLKSLVVHPSSAEILHTSGRDGPIERLSHQFEEELLDRFSFQRLRQLVYDVGDKVRENTSSMLQDVRAGKPTEIRDFNGWLVDTAKLLDKGIDLPTHKRLMTMVQDGLAIPRSKLSDYFDAPSNI